MRNSVFAELYSFEKLIALPVIKIVHVVGIAGIILWGIVGLFSAVSMIANDPARGIGNIFISIVGVLIAILFWRLFCETWVVMFGTYTRLGDIKTALTEKTNAE